MMDVEVIQTSPLERQIQIAVEATKVEEESTRALTALGRRVKVKGFRPGKIPVRELKRRYGKSVRRDVIQTLIRYSLGEALKRDDLESVIHVSPPEVTDDSGKGGFSFQFRAEVRPDLSPTGYLGLTVEVDDTPVSDEEVEVEIERLRKEHAVIEPVTDRDVVEAGDSVTVSYTPVNKEADLDFLSAEDQAIDLSEEGISSPFKDGIVGMSIGDVKEITLTFPEGSPAAERVGGTEAALSVTLHAIKQRVLPELDDDFASEAADTETVEALRQKIRDDLDKVRLERMAQEKGTQLEEKLCGLVEFDLPASFLESRVEDEVNRQVNQIRQAGLQPEQLGTSLTAMRAEAAEGIAKKIRLEFVLSAIADREKIKPNKADIEARIKSIADSAGPSAAQVHAFYSSPQNVEGLTERLRLDKTLDFLLAKATISSEETPVEDVTPAESEGSTKEDAPAEVEGAGDE